MSWFDYAMIAANLGAVGTLVLALRERAKWKALNQNYGEG